MSEEIRKRVVRVLINFGVLSLIVIASGLSIPGILALFSILPAEGLSVGSFLMLVLTTISTFFALRILLDIVKLVDLASDLLIKHIPGLSDRKRISIVRALKEVMLAFFLVLFSTVASPVLLLIPRVGPWLSLGVSMTVLIISLFLIYDSGRTLYAIFESWIQLFVDKLSRPEAKNQAGS